MKLQEMMSYDRERQRPRPVSSILGWVNETSGDDELLHGKAKAQMAKKK
jgi:hypothetical protein